MTENDDVDETPLSRSQDRNRPSASSAQNARIKRFSSEYIGWLTTFQTRRRWVAVDETAIKINDEWSQFNTAIDLDTKVILDVSLFNHHGTNPAAAFLHGLCEKHDCSETVLLADAFGYRTAFSRLGLSGRVDSTERNLIKKWFHTLKT